VTKKRIRNGDTDLVPYKLRGLPAPIPWRVTDC